MFALDTNTVSYFLKGIGRVAERLLATPPREIALPAVVLYEIEVGAASVGISRKRRTQLDALVAAASVLPFGLETARTAAGIRVRLERQGSPIGPLDTLIAATALESRATLVTHNVREFGRVKGLEVEDWY